MDSEFFLLFLTGFGTLLFVLYLILQHLKSVSRQLKGLQEQIASLNQNQRASSVIYKPEVNTTIPESEKKQTYFQEELSPIIASKPVVKPKPSFLGQTDWEKFIGENLINKIGIIVLVLGIGFFVRFAIEQNWITELGRVLIGLFCGGLLLGIAHWLRKNYPAFSSVLVGGSLAILYFTVALAFHQYHLISQAVAFIGMVAITGLSVFMAVLYDRKELAILALLGGFGSPFMATAGGGNYLILFSYVLILDVGMLVLAYFKRWPIITYISYGATVALFAGWLFSGIAWVSNAPYIGTWLFAVAFYLTFFLMDIIYNLRRERKFTLPELTLLLSNTTFFYLSALYLLSNIHQGTYEGIYTGALALFNGLAAWLLVTRTRTDRKFIYLLAAIAIAFLYLALLLELLYQLRASTLVFETKIVLTAIYHYLFIALLLFYAQRQATAKYADYLVWLALVGIFSYIGLALGIIPALRDQYALIGNNGIVYYLHFAALFLIIVILYFGYRLVAKNYPALSRWPVYATWFIAAAIIFILSTELDNLVLISSFSPGKSIAHILNQTHRIGFAVLWSLCSFAFMVAGMKWKNKNLRFISLTLFAITILKLFLFDIKDLSAGSRITAFILLGILLLVVSFLYQKLKILILTDDPGRSEVTNKTDENLSS